MPNIATRPRTETARPRRGDHEPNDPADGGYVLLTRLIERLHRRHLDLLRLELHRLGVDDISPAQALLLTRIDDRAIAVRDLVERGYYLGSNASYNIKQLVKAGYAVQERATHDRRSLRVRLTARGGELCARLSASEAAHAERISADTAQGEDLETACRALRRLEQAWADHIRFDR